MSQHHNVSGKFQRRLFLIYSLITFILTQVVLNTFYAYSASNLKKESALLLAQTNEKVVYKLDTMLNNMDGTALQVISDANLQPILVASNNYTGPYNYFDYHSRAEVQNMLFAINTPLLNNARISIFDAEKNYVTVGSLSTQGTVFLQNFDNDYMPFFLSGPDGTTTMLVAPHQDSWSNREGQIVFSYLRAIPSFLNSKTVLGVVEVSQSYFLLEDACREATDSSLEVAILDADKNLVYPYQALAGDVLADYPLLADATENSTEFTRGEQGSFYYYSQNTAIGSWTVFVSQKASDYLAPVTALRRTMLLFELVFYLLTFLILYFITRMMTRPITHLRRMVEDLTPENLSLATEDTSFASNEITLLSQAFNNTIQKLNRATEENLIANRNQAEAHVLAMQSQMNPHFLYNTLMAISGIAEQSDNTAIIQICSKLSSMLHYISSFKEPLVPLSDELIYTRDYLELMKIRYESFLEYSIEADEAALTCLTPKLILQPLVENCFSHGFKHIAPPYRVHIIITARNGLLTLSVYDNGEGFSQEMLDAFAEKVKAYDAGFDTQAVLRNSELGGLGLNNIYLRLLLQSKHRLVMRLENDPERGGRVYIQIPMEKRGAENV